MADCALISGEVAAQPRVCVCMGTVVSSCEVGGFLGSLCTQFLFGKVKVEADARSGDPYSFPLGVTMATQQQVHSRHC